MLISSFLVCVIVVNIIQFGVFVLYFKEYLKLLGTVQVFVWNFFFFNRWGWVRVNIIVQSNAIGFTGMICYVGKENLNREKIGKEMRQS